MPLLLLVIAFFALALLVASHQINVVVAFCFGVFALLIYWLATGQGVQ